MSLFCDVLLCSGYWLQGCEHNKKTVIKQNKTWPKKFFFIFSSEILCLWKKLISSIW